MKRILCFFLFSNLYVALPVSALAIVSFFLVRIEINRVMVVFLYCATLFLYCLHRALGLERLKESEMAERHKWALENPNSFFTTLALAGAAALIYSSKLGLHTYLLLAPVIVLALAYSVPVFKKEGQWQRLRDIAFLKIFLISIVVAYVTVILPLYPDQHLRSIGKLELFLLYIERVFFILAITIPFDIRDVVYDSKKGLKTIPSFFGLKKAKAISTLALLLFILVCILHLLFIPRLGLGYFTALVFSAVIAGWAILKSNSGRSDTFYSLFVEGTMLVQAALIIAVAYLL